MREALKQALEFIEGTSIYLPHTFDSDGLSIHATIKQALAAPVQEPVAWIRGSGLEMLKLENGGHATVYASEGMSNYSQPLYTTPPAAHVQQKPLFTDIIAQHPDLAEELKAMDAAPVQEPDHIPDATKMVAAQRPWVGLTQQEVQEIHDTYHKRMGPQEFAVMLEQRLKEKNT